MKHLLPRTLLLIAALAPARAQLPSECLLIVNAASPDALRVANTYIDLRGIPSERVLYLSPPQPFFLTDEGTPQWTASAQNARREVVTPIREKLAELNDPIPTALIFSPAFPTRIRAEGAWVSLTAFAGTLGDLPDPEAIQNGQARSPWFTSPEERNQGRLLHRYPASHLKNAGLLPSMMLGVFYDPLDPDALVQILQRAVNADFSAPEGAVALITNDDVRTRARRPQITAAMHRFRRRGIPLHNHPHNVPLPNTLIGAMEGAATLPIQRRYQGKLVPGSFAEHLTSFAAAFHTDSQTKMTHWLAAGAAGTVGTVDEPRSIWTKFPLVEIFERYTLGNTLLEALMQSIGCPYQSLPIGDPLCRPWANTLPNLSLDTSWEENTLVIRAEGVRTGPSTHLHLFVNGTRLPGDGPEWRWEAQEEDTGPRADLLLHARRVWAPPEVATLRKQVETPFEPRLTLHAANDSPRNTLRLTAENAHPLVQWEIFHGHRRVFTGSTENTRPQTDIPLDTLGGGPITLHARGVQSDGTLLRSAPLRIEPKSVPSTIPN